MVDVFLVLLCLHEEEAGWLGRVNYNPYSLKKNDKLWLIIKNIFFEIVMFCFLICIFLLGQSWCTNRCLILVDELGANPIYFKNISFPPDENFDVKI